MQRLNTSMTVAKKEGRPLPPLPNYVFLGNPGTGKTTVARAMGRILFRAGALATNRVEETSGQDLTGEYVGQARATL